MADPEQLAAHPGQPRPESQVVSTVSDVYHLRTVDAWGHHDRADRVRVPLGRTGTQLQAPRLDRLPSPLSQAMVPGKDVLQTLFHQDGERLSQSIQQRKRRSVGEVSGAVRLSHVPKVEEYPTQLCAVVQRERLLAGTHDSQAGRQHQTLL